MDDEGKIKEITQKSKNVFLEWKKLRVGSTDLYDLEKEFAVTRKNKNYIVLISILVFLIIVAGTAFAVTRYIQETGKVVPINIADFEDVNLKDILDIAKNYEFRLNNARTALERLKISYDEDVNQIRQKYQRDVEIIREGSESDPVKSRRIAAAAGARDNALREADAEYKSQIALLEQEIAETELALASYDATVIEQARRQEEILNNQKVMADLQLQETIDNYERRIETLTARYESELSLLKRDNDRLINVLRTRHRAELKAMYDKYDPVYSPGNVKNILLDGKTAVAPVYAGDTAVKILEQNSIMLPGGINNARREAADVEILVKRLKDIPFENSNKTALERLLQKGSIVTGFYESVLISSSNAVDEKNLIIRSFRNAFDYYIKATGVSGYVIDSSDTSNIYIYMNKTLDIGEGDKAYVFRGDDEPIGEIEFFYSNNNLLAREIFSSERFPLEKMNIRPFDRILARIK